jgi:hypothetical protein
MLRYGVPDEVLTLNGKVFTGRFGTHRAEVLFDRMCRENGISHRLMATHVVDPGQAPRFLSGKDCWIPLRTLKPLIP